MRKKIALHILCIHLFSFNILQSGFAKDSDDAKFCSVGIEKKVEKKAGDYRIKISYANERMCQHLDIFKNNKIVFHEEGIDNHYTLGNDPNEHNKNFVRNLIGKGSQLVISKWTGGAHCCTSLLVFDLENEFKKIAEIEGGNYEIEIVDLDHDGIPEIRVLDDFLAYRFSSFAYSAKAQVILKYRAGHYVLAKKQMRKPTPHMASFKTKIQKWRALIRKHENDWPPPQLIQEMTDLIFSENEKSAFELLDKAWPADVDGKSEFLKSYQEALAESKYYPEFQRH